MIVIAVKPVVELDFGLIYHLFTRRSRENLVPMKCHFGR